MATKYFILSIGAIAIGSPFQFGYQSGVPNQVDKIVRGFIANASQISCPDRDSIVDCTKTTTIWTFIVSSFLIGGMFGATAAGNLANEFGRKKSLLYLSIPTLLGSFLMSSTLWVNHWWILIVGRFFIGFSSGAYTAIAPMYMSEIAPLKIKGAAGSICQLTIVSAILISQCLGLPDILGTPDRWPFLFGFSAVPAILQLCILPFSPESPFYLQLGKSDTAGARKALQYLRNEEDVENELNLVIAEVNLAANLKHKSFGRLLMTRNLRRALIAAVGLHMVQQLSGINSTIYYSCKVFEYIQTTMSEHNVTSLLVGHAPYYATLIMGIINLLVTIVSACIVDKVGRRLLMLIGISGMVIMSLLLTISFYQIAKGESEHVLAWSFITIVGIYFFVAFFASGPGSVPWFYIAEIFTSENRGAAMTACTLVNWVCNIEVGLTTPHFYDWFPEFLFLPFMATLLLSLVFIFLFIPETRNRTPEEMELEFQRSKMILHTKKSSLLLLNESLPSI